MNTYANDPEYLRIKELADQMFPYILKGWEAKEEGVEYHEYGFKFIDPENYGFKFVNSRTNEWFTSDSHGNIVDYNLSSTSIEDAKKMAYLKYRIYC